jgi:hypothetical protein
MGEVPDRSRQGCRAGYALLLAACTAEAAITGPVATVALTEPAAPVAVARPAPPVAAPAPVAASAPPPATAVEATDDATDDGCVDSFEALPGGGALSEDDRRRTKGTVVVVRKAKRRLLVFVDGAATHCFPIALGFAPVGHKQVQGDGKTPEGIYRTSDKPWSSFEHAIAIHYPNGDDARAAAADGRISTKTRDRILGDLREGRVPPQSTKLGGAVLIHGGGASFDWTLGCIALADSDLLTLRSTLPRGMRTDLVVLP